MSDCQWANSSIHKNILGYINSYGPTYKSPMQRSSCNWKWLNSSSGNRNLDSSGVSWALHHSISVTSQGAPHPSRSLEPPLQPPVAWASLHTLELENSIKFEELYRFPCGNGGHLGSITTLHTHFPKKVFAKQHASIILISEIEPPLVSSMPRLNMEGSTAR